MKDANQKLLRRNPWAQKINLAFARKFLKHKKKPQLEKTKLKEVTYRSKLMKAIMVDDIATDDSMKDVDYEDIKSSYSNKEE